MAQKVANIFKIDYPDRDRLSGLLRDSGLVYQPFGETVGMLALNMDHIKIRNAKDGTEEDSLRRFLSRVLTIQSTAGGYEKVIEPPEAKIEAADIKSLESFLTKRSFDVMGMKGWLHQHVVDYIMKDRIKYTNLKLDQTDTLMKVMLGLRQLSKVKQLGLE
jgi:hypothetical protein